MADDVRPANEWTKVTPALWQKVSIGMAYPWSVGPQARRELAELLPGVETTGLFTTEDAAVINMSLRDRLSPILAGEGRPRAARAALWIVKSWGGIKRGADQVAVWSEALGDYDDERVIEFIEARGTARISSWSKLLAFAKPMHHAIYDARTAVALNCALAQLGDERRFHMPASQNRKIKAARSMLGPSTTPDTRGYEDYLSLLTSAVSGGRAADILRAEMTLFANGPLIAEQFCRQQGDA